MIVRRITPAAVVSTARDLPALRAFTPRGQKAFLALISGTTNHRSQLVREAIVARGLLAPKTPADKLVALLDDPALTPVVLKREAIALPKTGLTYALSPLPGAPGLKRIACAVAGRAIPLDIASSLDAPAIAARIGDALASVPAEVRAQLSSVFVSDAKNPDDDYFSELYGVEVLAAMGCGKEGRLHVFPEAMKQDRDTFVRNLFHEAGHTFSIRAWGRDEAGAGWNPWRAAAAEDVIAPSYYATCSVHEDAAETFLLYLISRGTPAFKEYQAMFPKRFALIEGALARANR